MEFTATRLDVLILGKITRKNVIGAVRNSNQKQKTRYIVVHLAPQAITVNEPILTYLKGLTMQEHVNKVIQKRNEIASAIIAGIKEAGRYDKPWDKQEAISLSFDGRL